MRACALETASCADREADQKLITQLEPIVYQELRKSRHFTLIRPRLVKSNRAYRLLQGESTDGMYSTKVARGYEKFDPKIETARSLSWASPTSASFTRSLSTLPRKQATRR